MENRMEEIKHNMSSLFERRYDRLVQQVEEKFSNQHVDQTGKESTEFFLKNTNRTFLAFLYKIDITGFQNQQK